MDIRFFSRKQKEAVMPPVKQMKRYCKDKEKKDVLEEAKRAFLIGLAKRKH